MSGKREQIVAGTLGYAALLTAFTLIGSAFPALHSQSYLQESCIRAFNAGQSLFVVSLVAVIPLSYLIKNNGRSSVFAVCACMLSLTGAALLAMLDSFGVYAEPVAGLAGGLTGVGNACLILLWQKAFSLQGKISGIMEIIAGSALAGVLYLPLSALLTSVLMVGYFVIIGSSAALLTFCLRSSDVKEPVYIGPPESFWSVTKITMSAIWKQVLYIAAFAFAWGSVCASIPHDSVMAALVNDYSSIGRIASSIILFVLWRGFSNNKISLEDSYQVIFPLVGTLFVLLPFFGETYMMFFSLFLYLIFSVASMLMMITCIKVTHERGVHPMLVYGLFASIVYAARSAGLAIGSSSYISEKFGLPAIMMIALVCIYLLLIVVVTLRRRQSKPKQEENDADKLGIECARNIQFASSTASDTNFVDYRYSMNTSNKDESAVIANIQASEQVIDCTTQHCEAIAQQAALSHRESEVLELIAHGRDVPAISKSLFISKNTTQTHIKNIYRKLNIHNKQELLDLVEKCDI